MESIYESYYNEQSQTMDWENAFEKEHVPDWQRELLQNADRVEAGFGGGFRYFKDVLLDYPAERERWFQFKRERLHLRILDWLEAYGITPLQ